MRGVMKRRPLLVPAISMLVSAVLACGSHVKAPAQTASAGILPERIDGTGWLRSPGLQHFAGDSLFEYIDGAAEMYHKYGFIEVTVATYVKDDNTITADLYLFETPDQAFGMYTTLRPDEPDTISLGVEGFRLDANMVFVKGSRLVNVYTYDDFEGALAAVRAVASALEGGLPGTMVRPAVFGLFPGKGRVAFTEKIFAEGFLGYGFLTEVYTVEYAEPYGRFRLFIVPDPDAVKFDRWLDVASTRSDPVPGWTGGLFEEAKSLRTVHDYHGEIVAGWRGGRLVGMVGYVPAYREDLVGWARSL
jgi:hypothetical protein